MSAEQVAVGFADIQRQPLDDKIEIRRHGTRTADVRCH